MKIACLLLLVPIDGYLRKSHRMTQGNIIFSVSLSLIIQFGFLPRHKTSGKLQLPSEGIFIRSQERREVSYKIAFSKCVSHLHHYKAFTTILSLKNPNIKKD